MGNLHKSNGQWVREGRLADIGKLCLATVNTANEDSTQFSHTAGDSKQHNNITVIRTGTIHVAYICLYVVCPYIINSRPYFSHQGGCFSL